MGESFGVEARPVGGCAAEGAAVDVVEVFVVSERPGGLVVVVYVELAVGWYPVGLDW